jgi:hypothetical protein
LLDDIKPKRQWCHLDVANRRRMNMATEKEPNTRPKKCDQSVGSASAATSV